MQLTIENLCKNYRGGVQALHNVQLSLKPGVLGLLGPNGAGKSTLMRILATITQASSGRVLWNDTDIARNPDALRGGLGYLPQDFGVYPNLSAIEFLDYLAAVKGIPAAAAHQRISELLAVVNLADAAKRPLGGYSGGMRQRVGIAQALLNDPQLLIVDEPTAGLDPEERVRFRNLLSELSGERIVILSTHIVSDVEAVATDIAILAHGQLLAHAAPEALLSQVTGKIWEVVVPSADLPALPSAVQPIAAMASMHVSSQIPRPQPQLVNSSHRSKTPTLPSSPGSATPPRPLELLRERSACHFCDRPR